MTTITDVGRAAVATHFKNSPLHIAWGDGGAWGSTPPENPSATALVRELGRRAPIQVEYVTPDPDGDIETPNDGNFSVSATPTNCLLVAAQFRFEEEATATIRETALFAYTQTVAGLPAGQKYFTPDDLANTGTMLQFRNLGTPIVRDSEFRTRLEHVVIF